MTLKAHISKHVLMELKYYALRFFKGVLNVNELNKNITSVAIGIRFNKMFTLLDSWGSIVDKVWGNSPDFLGDDYFSGISGNYITERILINEKTGNYLKITAADIIFRHSFEEKEFESEFSWFKKCVNELLIPEIILKYNVSKFTRIGIIFTYKFNNKDVFDSITKKIINTEMINVNDIRFSVKATVPNALLKKGVDDYINIIYNMSTDNDNNTLLSYDYQYYLKPKISDFRQFPHIKFIENSISSLDTKLYSWIEGNGKNGKK